MPIPKPKDDETRSDFMARCMGDDLMAAEFPDREQRGAICMTSWRKDKGKSDDLPDVVFSLPLGKAETSAGGDDAGWIEGYAATWDIDLAGERFKRGAFKKSIGERVKAGKVKVITLHYAYGGAARDVVGTVTEAREDAKGLWFHGELAGTEHAQELRQLVGEGHLGGLSVGFRPITWEDDPGADGKEKPYRTYTEAVFVEVTVTPSPANEAAGITAAKSAAAPIPAHGESGEGAVSPPSRAAALLVKRRRLALERIKETL